MSVRLPRIVRAEEILTNLMDEGSHHGTRVQYRSFERRTQCAVKELAEVEPGMSGT